jgi:hypothetical protein
LKRIDQSSLLVGEPGVIQEPPDQAHSLRGLLRIVDRSTQDGDFVFVDTCLGIESEFIEATSPLDRLDFESAGRLGEGQVEIGHG